MSDPSALLQHILAAVEKIKMSHQSLQQNHHELQTQFAASKVDFEAKFAVLSLMLIPNSPPPSSHFSHLLGDPFLSDADTCTHKCCHPG